MIVSRQAFLQNFPEFKNVDPNFVERKLLAAEDITPYNIWGNKRREGIMLAAAHKLAMSPLGQEVRLDITDPTSDIQTTYEKERKDLARVVAMGLGKVI